MSKHPLDEDLELYYLLRLSPNINSSIETHISECEICKEKIERFAQLGRDGRKQATGRLQDVRVSLEGGLSTHADGLALGHHGALIPAPAGIVQPGAVTFAEVRDQPFTIACGNVPHRLQALGLQLLVGARADAIDLAAGQRPDAGGQVFQRDDADAIGLVGRMPSGPGPIEDELIKQIAVTIPPPIATFLLTCETSAGAIISHHKRTFTNTIQLVDELPVKEYAIIKDAIPAIKLVQVIHVIDESSVELFADDGLSVMTEIFFPSTPYNKANIQAADNTIKQLQYTPYKSIV